MVSLKKVEQYQKKKKSIHRVVRSKIDPHEIVYGARAINRQLPPMLRTTTEDWDILSRTPKKDAREVEKALDKHFGGDFFEIAPAVHKGTYRVRSKVEGKTYVDYTGRRKKTPFVKIGGIKYVTLPQVKKSIRKTLKDPTAKYRHDKDRYALNRILLAEKRKK